MPWNDEHVVATRLFRLWPFPRNWRVVSRVPSELAETTMFVEELTCSASTRVIALQAFGRSGSAPRFDVEPS